MSNLYDIVPYPGVAYAFACPDRMSVFGRLHGLAVRPVAEATILELGVGDGANLLAIAQRFPNATCIGVDASEGALGAARKRAATLKRNNVTLLAAPLETLASDGPLPICDYVIAHGLTSWITPEVRTAMFGLIGRVLAPSGVAIISFLTHPGQHDLAPLAELMRHHVETVADPTMKVQQARDIARWQLERTRRLHGAARANLLEQLVVEVMEMPDAVLFHDLLSPERHPFSVSDFERSCRTVGLQWLSNARMNEPRTALLPENLRELTRATPDPVRRQHYLDSFLMTRFRTSLVCRAEAAVSRSVEPAAFAGFSAASRWSASGLATLADGLIETSVGRLSVSPSARTLLGLLAETSPSAIRLEDLLSPDAPHTLDAESLLGGVAELWLADAIELTDAPPAIAHMASGHPETGPLQRLIATEGRGSATSLWHREHALEALELETLAACDGITPAASLSTDALEVLVLKGFLLAAGAA